MTDSVETLLINQIKKGSLEKVKEILNKNTHLISRSLISHAISAGKIKIIKYLISRGCKIKYDFVYLFKCSLEQMIRTSNPKMMEYFLELKPSFRSEFKSKPNSKRFLCLAVANNSISVFEYLIQLGCDPKSCEKDLFSAIGVDSLSGDLLMAKYLINIGLDFKSQQNKIIWLAIEENDLDFIKVLVDLSGNFKDFDMGSCNNFSLRLFPMFQYLVSVGCIINHVDPRVVYWVIDNDHLEIIKFFVEKTDSNIQRYFPEALKRALIHDRFEILEYLVGVGAEVDFNCKQQEECFFSKTCACSLLRYALRVESCNRVKFLIKIGIDANLFPEFIYQPGPLGPTIYSFDLLTKQNKIKFRTNFKYEYRHQMRTYLPHANETFAIQQKIINFRRKNRILKFILKPISMHTQLILIE
jgi:ankyrin repeat protein